MALHEGSVHLQWREEYIIPLFKKGSRNRTLKYLRKVSMSLTLVICKLLEIKIKCHSGGIFLQTIGMVNSIINWIEHWLTDRRQRVDVDGELSIWKISLEWGATMICVRTYFISDIHQ